MRANRKELRVWLQLSEVVGGGLVGTCNLCFVEMCNNVRVHEMKNFSRATHCNGDRRKEFLLIIGVCVCVLRVCKYIV